LLGWSAYRNAIPASAASAKAVAITATLCPFLRRGTAYCPTTGARKGLPVFFLSSLVENATSQRALQIDVLGVAVSDGRAGQAAQCSPTAGCASGMTVAFFLGLVTVLDVLGPPQVGHVDLDGRAAWASSRILISISHGFLSW